jgi:hypothetical protein
MIYGSHAVKMEVPLKLLWLATSYELFWEYTAPSNVSEESQKGKNIQQAGFPDGHPL